MDISVIIPTYKPQDYLWRCLDSLACQTIDYNTFEIILVLNGCKEPYYSRIIEYMTKNYQLNINFIQTDYGGVSNARNIGLEKAKGYSITFIDDDDYVSPRFLEALLKVGGQDIMGISNAVAVINNKEQPYAMGQAYVYNKQHNKRGLYNNRKYMSGPCMKIFNKETIGKRRFNTNFTNGEDSLFMFMISDRIKQCDFASEDAIYYRCYRENSLFMTKRSFFKRLRNSLKLIFEYTCIFISHPFRYSFIIYITRVAASIHSAIKDH